MWDVSVNPFGISFLSLFQAFYRSSKQNRTERCWTEHRKISHTTEIQCYPVVSLKFPLSARLPAASLFFFQLRVFTGGENISILIKCASPFPVLKKEPLSFITACCERETSFRPHSLPSQGPIFTRATPPHQNPVITLTGLLKRW